MEIISVKWEKIQIPLKKPFKIALGTTTHYTGYILKICAAGLCGYGEAVPSPRITGDTLGSIEHAFQMFKRVLIGKELTKIGEIMNQLNSLLTGNSSAKAAVDMALHDLLGRRLRIRVSDLLGGEREEIETSLTIGIGGVRESVRQAVELVDAGAKILKVKIGLDPEQDVERIREIRNVTDARIRVDANQGYSLKRALKVLKNIERYEIEFVEQPVERHRLDALRILRKSVDIPIMADESVHTKEDALNLVDVVDAINIKLMKSGGIREALKIASVARAAGMDIMVGCMVETKLGIAAAQNFALGIGADYADLDGYWDLTRQPFEGLDFRDGKNIISGDRGFGVECKDESIC